MKKADPTTLMNCYEFKYRQWLENPDDDERHSDFLNVRKEIMRRLWLLDDIKKKVGD